MSSTFSLDFFPRYFVTFFSIDDDDQSESNVTQTKKKTIEHFKISIISFYFSNEFKFRLFFVLFPVVVVVNLDCNLSSSSSSIVIWSTNVQLLLMMMMMMFQCLNITLMMMIILMLVAYNNNNNKVVTACLYIKANQNSNDEKKNLTFDQLMSNIINNNSCFSFQNLKPWCFLYTFIHWLSILVLLLTLSNFQTV